jgi:hypothetical protein
MRLTFDDVVAQLQMRLREHEISWTPDAFEPLRRVDFHGLSEAPPHEYDLLLDQFAVNIVAAHRVIPRFNARPGVRRLLRPASMRAAILKMGAAIRMVPEQQVRGRIREGQDAHGSGQPK